MRTWHDFDMIQLVILPLFLFSGTFYPLSVYPSFLQPIMQISPLYHGTELLRAFTLGTFDWTLTGHAAVLVAMGAVGLAITSRRLDEPPEMNDPLGSQIRRLWFSTTEKKPEPGSVRSASPTSCASTCIGGCASPAPWTTPWWTCGNRDEGWEGPSADGAMRRSAWRWEWRSAPRMQSRPCTVTSAPIWSGE